VQRESDSRKKWKGDDSVQSSLFTLRNPRGVPAWKFALKAQQK
jgi:hypothetical protein